MPPSEAVKEIDIISGESSLEFGPQFGGVLNYVLKDAPPDKPFQYTTSETGGSFGMFNSFNSIGGTLGKWSYYAWTEYQGFQGWRPNSEMQTGVGYAKLQFNTNEKFSISFEYSIQRNLIHIPGGLDDAEFARNPDTSTRPRNWMATPASFAALTTKWKITGKTILILQSVFNNSQRNLVWRNDNINIGLPDSITPAGAYAEREVEHWEADNSTTEIRLLANYNIAGKNQTFATGLRLYAGYFNSNDRGPGTTGLDFDMSMPGAGQTYGRAVWIHDYNLAPYVENTFRIGKLSVTPGFRYEYLTSSVNGYFTNWDSLGTIPSLQSSYFRNFLKGLIPLGGIALQFVVKPNINIYANFAQAYAPLNYEDLYPGSVSEIIDPKLHDVNGYNGDIGFRGNIKNCLAFDIGGFYVLYQGAIGTEVIDTLGTTRETNLGNAVHEGIESYIDWNIMKTFTSNSPVGYIDIFNSFSYDNAKYTSGPYSGNWVEDAPQYISRIGITYAIKNFSATFFFNYTSQEYTDANNTINNTIYLSQNAEVGIIPSYRICDLSASLKIKNFVIKAGIDNLTNASYFTIRTVEYPGPGILPGLARSGYLGFSATF